MAPSLHSASEEETRRIGERIGERLSGGDILALAGRLGAGKTCLTKGIARGLGLREEDVISPTYTLIREVSGPVRLFHIDLYRITGLDDLENAGFYDAFAGDAVTVIEWGDRFPSLVPEPYLMIRLIRVDDQIREIAFEPHGQRPRDLIERFFKEIPDAVRK
jgi:tRNA threonylcarbamoyladenosine biosynthesis protein TsaE